MNKQTIIILVAIFLLANFALFVSSRGLIPFGGFSLPTNTIILPVPLSAKSVVSASIFYNFQGRLKSIDQADETNFRLKLDTADNLPELLAPATMKFQAPRGDDFIPTTIDQLAVGSNITVGASYDLRTKKWTVLYVMPTPSSVKKLNTAAPKAQ